MEVPAGGRATVEFQPLDVPYGLSRCAIRIDSADGFPADDSSIFSVKRSDPERVLFVHQPGDQRSALYFGAALAATSQAVVHAAVDRQRKDQRCRSLEIRLRRALRRDALPSIFENALTQYVRGGGNVLIAAGTSAAHHARIPMLWRHYVPPTRIPTRATAMAGVGQTDLTYPVMKRMPPVGADLKIYYATTWWIQSQARVIVRLTDQTPLLDRKADRRRARAACLLRAFDNLTNDLPVRPAFVPFVDRAARYLSGNDSLAAAGWWTPTLCERLPAH